MDLLDQADINLTKQLEAQIASRERFTEWDGNPRACEECGLEIAIKRLKAINATTCIDCAKRKEK